VASGWVVLFAGSAPGKSIEGWRPPVPYGPLYSLNRLPSAQTSLNRASIGTSNCQFLQPLAANERQVILQNQNVALGSSARLSMTDYTKARGWGVPMRE